MTLIDRNAFSLFTPLLHEAVVGVIPPGLILTPIRRVLRDTRVEFLRARVQGVDLERQTIALCCEERPYDVLVIALGSVTKFHGLESVRERALEIKDASDEVRTVLIEVRDRVLPHMDRALSRTALRRMQRMGIELMLNTTVTHLTDEGLIFADGGQPLLTDTVIWAAGVRAGPALDALAVDKDGIGRITVGSDLSVPGAPNVYVVGDAAHARHPQTREVYPPTAQVAYRQAPSSRSERPH